MVDLGAKAEPSQARAHRTRERILDAAAELLGEQGVERISTNTIAARAGVTPPALYRYFPNKYAVMRACGQRLMTVQNEVFHRWLAELPPREPGAPLLGPERARRLLEETFEVTRRQRGALYILRALRAVPSLQGVRLASHHEVAAALTRALAGREPSGSTDPAWITARLSVEMGYAAIEMALEEEDLDFAAIAARLADMIGQAPRWI